MSRSADMFQTGENIYTLNTASLPSRHHSFDSPVSPMAPMTLITPPPSSQRLSSTPNTPMTAPPSSQRDPFSSISMAAPPSSQRDPFSPLPPTPPLDEAVDPFNQSMERDTDVLFSLDIGNDTAPQLDAQARRQLFSSSSDTSQPPAYSAPLPRHNSVTVTSPLRSMSSESSSPPPIPERRFSTPAFPVAYDSPPLSPYPFPEIFEGDEPPRSPISLPPTPGTPSSQFSLLPDKMREALGLQEDFAGQNNAVEGWNMPPPDDRAAPPPYMGRNILERGANKSLKMSQVQQLHAEMTMEGGLKVRLRKIDCYHTIALVDCYDSVW